jgi:hypothetical protein
MFHCKESGAGPRFQASTSDDMASRNRWQQVVKGMRTQFLTPRWLIKTFPSREVAAVNGWARLLKHNFGGHQTVAPILCCRAERNNPSKIAWGA